MNKKGTNERDVKLSGERFIHCLSAASLDGSRTDNEQTAREL